MQGPRRAIPGFTDAERDGRVARSVGVPGGILWNPGQCPEVVNRQQQVGWLKFPVPIFSATTCCHARSTPRTEATGRGQNSKDFTHIWKWPKSEVPTDGEKSRIWGVSCKSSRSAASFGVNAFKIGPNGQVSLSALGPFRISREIGGSGGPPKPTELN